MDEQTETTWTPIYDADRYSPSLEDVLDVKSALNRKLKLPMELIDPIIDFAEYWPHTTTITEGAVKSVRAGSTHENVFITRSYPLGFIPDWNDRKGYQMMDQYEGKFQSLTPQTWDEERHIPHSSSYEVLQAWSTASQPRGEFPCRKIVFTTLSHDQGWGGDNGSKGTYKGSFTWFDVGKEEFSAFREVALLEAWEIAPWPQFRLYVDGQSSSSEAISSPPTSSNPAPLVCSLRTITPRTKLAREAYTDPETKNHHKAEYVFEHPLTPAANRLQANVVAEKPATEHKITWSWTDNIDPESLEASELETQGRGGATGNGEYVRSLKAGDAVTVWAKARFSGWVNVVESVKIDLYWAV